MNDSYKNPFNAVNAAQMEVDSILEYWCNPFNYKLFSGIRQEDVFEDPMNIVFMGGRSTGKSMFLRYWSYQVQSEAAQKENRPLLDVIKKNKGIGIYFRIDGMTLRSFYGSDLSEEHWSSVFTHYFELIVGRQLVEVMRLLQVEGTISEEMASSGFIDRLCKHLRFKVARNLDAVIEEFDKRISDVDLFRGDVPFHGGKFNPKNRGFASESITFGVSEVILKLLPSLKDVNIIFLLDEYENFLEYQQIVINTLLRFTRPKIKFRIGMRLEGFRTFRMIADEDFIKEGREYRKIVFEEVLNKNRGFHQFLLEIAKKRLESVSTFRERNLTNIKVMLGNEENLEQEAKELVRKKPNKTYEHFLRRVKVPKDQLDKVRHPDNPLMELLNFIWLTRGVSAQNTAQSMRDYLEGNKTPEAAKYHMDYINKYKLSLMFLLCSIYRKPKSYYSFNTFAFLSSGIVGHFIELCRRSFVIASWADDRLETVGEISPEFQSQAASEFSKDELHLVGRIETYGGYIYRFVNNIGNVFRDCHLDIRMRYPETNQFAMTLEAIHDDDLKKTMKAAIRWSVVQKKPKIQRKGPGEHLRDTYTINRAFAPSFQISYRTRGGKSIELNESRLKELVESEDVVTAAYFTRHPIGVKSADNQETLFPND